MVTGLVTKREPDQCNIFRTSHFLHLGAFQKSFRYLGAHSSSFATVSDTICNLLQMCSQRPFVDATTSQPVSCILPTFPPASLLTPSSRTFFCHRITGPPSAISLVVPPSSDQTAAGAQLSVLGGCRWEDEGGSREVGRRLHHRLSRASLPSLLQPPTCRGAHVTPPMCVTRLLISSMNFREKG